MAQVAADQQAWEKWIQERSKEACDELIQRYMPLVHYHVQRISVGLPKNVQKEDLISHGMFGLYDALEKFNHERDLKFDTYASFRVRGAIIDGLRKEDWLPRSVRDKIKKVETTIEKLEQSLGRFITSEEVAKELKMERTEVEQIMTEYYTASLLSIDELPQDQQKNEPYATTLEDKRTQKPEEKVVEDAIKEEITEVIEELSEKEQLVITLFYYEEMTLTEIAQILSLSTSRISQIHSKALFRMQQVMKKRKKEGDKWGW
ncbi:FliA/WhiG family RNA polymerase sigma factor [Bacillus sp. JCM 19034]|uniref:FliA/WhiG family RNA polymerase sigma factor n=1 Tax=Bacillus sp. JCM 19034 TaxID=1481928 RepID=UPI000783671E|nr:FliA/WhiG family RNA polymerase sigma factor [Bacillus sp. JCM 19034]